jgi:hypothetical protein
MKYSTLALIAALGLASAPALADRGDRYDRHHGRFVSPEFAAAHQALENRDEQLQREAATFRIGAVEREEIGKQRREIHQLQHQLEQGKRVDSYTLYRALGGEQHVIYFES